MKLHNISFALSGGIVIALCFGFTTLAALIGIPGFLPFAKILESGYAAYGYSLSWLGIAFGVLWGFVEGFIWFGLFSMIYNMILSKKE